LKLSAEDVLLLWRNMLRYSLIPGRRKGAGRETSAPSLPGRLGNGVINYLLDPPEYHEAPPDINTHPRRLEQCPT